VALQWTEAVAHQPAVYGHVRVAGTGVDALRAVNAAFEPNRVEGPGWVLTAAEVPAGTPLEVEVGSVEDRRVVDLLKSLPFACAEDCATRPGRRQPFELWLLADETLAASEPIEVETPPGAALLPLGLPERWRRVERRAEPLLAEAEGVAAETVPGRLYRVGPGSRPWHDRDYRILEVPAEVAGLPALRTSHERAKGDASLRLELLAPARVYAAFGPADPGDQWLDPQPGWQRLRAGGFRADVAEAGRDVWYRDFPEGPVELFRGERGNWLLLGPTRPTRWPGSTRKETSCSTGRSAS
jgi:hypothetical protein